MSSSHNFVFTVLFTDKGIFGSGNISNFHNDHRLEDVKLNGCIQDRHQQQFSVNVCAGIFGDWIRNLEGVSSINIIRAFGGGAIGCGIWIIVPRHTSAARPAKYLMRPTMRNDSVEEVLWIGRHDHKSLNSLDLWGHLKKIVYELKPTSEAMMKQRIVDAYILCHPIIIERSRHSMAYRFGVCIIAFGGHFQLFLWVAALRISYRLYVCNHSSVICSDLLAIIFYLPRSV